MTPREAEEKLLERKKRVAVPRGPASLHFTKIEKLAVQTLAADCHSQATIANRAGMSLTSLKRAFESDPALREAYDHGVAEERLKIDIALLKTALDSKNPRQVAAASALLKSRHGISEGGGQSVSVSVQNVLKLPSPQDARKYQAIIKRVAKQAPAIIGNSMVKEVPRVPVDPIKAVRHAQRGT